MQIHINPRPNHQPGLEATVVWQKGNKSVHIISNFKAQFNPEDGNDDSYHIISCRIESLLDNTTALVNRRVFVEHPVFASTANVITALSWLAE